MNYLNLLNPLKTFVRVGKRLELPNFEIFYIIAQAVLKRSLLGRHNMFCSGIIDVMVGTQQYGPNISYIHLFFIFSGLGRTHCEHIFDMQRDII